jgi:Flp pilus assembly secretin CpaC
MSSWQFSRYFSFPLENCMLSQTRHWQLQRRSLYPSIAVAVNKAVVIRLPKKATKVAVSQPKIAEVEVLAPDTVLIHGRAVGATSLVIWFEGQ